jgi:hypothetical protein
VGRALAHELSARIRKLWLRAHLGMRRADEDEGGSDRGSAETKEHDGLDFT